MMQSQWDKSHTTLTINLGHTLKEVMKYDHEFEVTVYYGAISHLIDFRSKELTIARIRSI